MKRSFQAPATHTLATHTLAIAAVAMMVAFSGAAQASTMVFEGQDAALFTGANPATISTLMSSVSRGSNPATAAASGAVTPGTLIEQSVESQISSQINNQIFNSTAASGSYNLGGGNLINFVRTGGNIVINVTDPVNGTTTITVPDL